MVISEFLATYTVTKILDLGFGQLTKEDKITYQKRLQKIIDATCKEYDNQAELHAPKFYGDDKFLASLSEYVLFETELSLDNVAQLAKNIPNQPKANEIKLFYSIFIEKITQDDLLKTLFYKENYPAKIYEFSEYISQKLDQIHDDVRVLHSQNDVAQRKLDQVNKQLTDMSTVHPEVIDILIKNFETELLAFKNSWVWGFMGVPAENLAQDIKSSFIRVKKHLQQSEQIDFLIYLINMYATVNQSQEARNLSVEYKDILKHSPLFDFIQHYIDCFEKRNAEGLKKFLEENQQYKNDVFYSYYFYVLLCFTSLSEAEEWLISENKSIEDLLIEIQLYYLLVLKNNQKFQELSVFIDKILLHKELSDYPIIKYFCSIEKISNLATTEELKQIIRLEYIPFNTPNLPLKEGSEAIEIIKDAQKLLTDIIESAKKLNINILQNLAEDYSFWLEIINPSTKSNALVKLNEVFLPSSSTSLASTLHLFPTAWVYKIEALDLQEMIKKIEIGLGSDEGHLQFFSAIACAYLFSIKQNIVSESHLIKVFEKFKSIFERFLMPIEYNYLELSLLIQTKIITTDDQLEKELIVREIEINTKQAQNLKAQLISPELSDGELQISKAIEIFEITKDIADLRRLVSFISDHEDYKEQFLIYAKLLFDQEQSRKNAEYIVRALYSHSKFSEHYSFLLEHLKGYVENSIALKVHWVSALFNHGDFTEAQNSLNSLRKLDDLLQYTTQEYLDELQIDLYIAQGKWESACSLAEELLKNNAKISIQKLQRFCTLIQNVNPHKVKDILIAIVNRDPDNISLKNWGYFMASRIGFEDDTEITPWITDVQSSAAHISELSNIDNVSTVFTGSIKEMLEFLSQGNQAQTRRVELFHNHECPVTMLSYYENTPLSKFYIQRAIYNTQSNILNKYTFPIFAKNRISKLLEKQKIGMDITSLMICGYLKILDKVIGAFEQIIIPHNTLLWLFKEKQENTFHQPSRVLRAEKLLDFIRTDKIKVISIEKSKLNAGIALDVGDELATFIENIKNSNKSNSIILLSNEPSHLNHEMEMVSTDILKYYPNIASCQNFIEETYKHGLITQSKKANSIKYLKEIKERTWEYLDISKETEIHVSYLAMENLLGSNFIDDLPYKNFTFVVSEETTKHINQLLDEEKIRSKVRTMLDYIRDKICDGIDQGKIQFSALSEFSSILSDYHDDNLDLLYCLDRMDSLVVDDIFYNQHSGQLQFEEKSTDIFTSLDLIETLHKNSSINMSQKMGLVLSLREAHLLYIPLSLEELNYYFDNSRIENTKLVETKELKIIRDYMKALQFSPYIKFQRDILWIHELHISICSLIRAQWNMDIDLDIIIARSNWLIELISFKNWLIDEEFEIKQAFSNRTHVIAIASLFYPMNSIPQDKMQLYLEWLDSIISAIKINAPLQYQSLVDYCENFMSQYIEQVLE